MSVSTKAAAVLWIGLGLYCLLWRFSTGGETVYTPTDVIAPLLLTGLLVILPAAALLLGRPFGWWTTMILSTFVIAQAPVRLVLGEFRGTMVIGTTVYCVVVLALLLLDRPSRWHTRHARR